MTDVLGYFAMFLIGLLGLFILSMVVLVIVMVAAKVWHETGRTEDDDGGV